MTKLVEDLLLLARLDADAPVEMQPVDIVAVVLNAVSDARAAGPDHIWRLELPEEGFEVRANADRLHQVIVNLLSNARNHTPAGTTVTTVAGIKDGQACLMVVGEVDGTGPVDRAGGGRELRWPGGGGLPPGSNVLHDLAAPGPLTRETPTWNACLVVVCLRCSAGV